MTLSAPFVGNRIDPSQFSPAAVKIANHELFPKSTHPCGEIRYKRPGNTNDEQYVARVDYQWSANHSIFGRYIDTFERVPAAWQRRRTC